MVRYSRISEVAHLPDIQSRQLFSGSLVALRDCSCRSPMGPCGSEEASSTNQVVFTRTGVFVKHTGRRSVVGEPTQALFLNRNETYRVSHPASGGDNCTVMSVQPGLLAEVLSGYNRDAGDLETVRFAISHARLEPQLILAHHTLRRTCQLADVDHMRVEETAIELLASTIDAAYRARGVALSPARPGTIESRRDLTEATKVLLCGNPTATHSLSALARELNSSPFHLARIFRNEVGLPIHQYLLRLRLVLALERLADGCTNLSALALDLGFSNHSHFSTLFGRIFRTSPSAFRRNLRGATLQNLRKSLSVVA
jgi:AraC family transcriptional regulator